jgi:hypothetical protein
MKQSAAAAAASADVDNDDDDDCSGETPRSSGAGVRSLRHRRHARGALDSDNHPAAAAAATRPSRREARLLGTDSDGCDPSARDGDSGGRVVSVSPRDIMGPPPHPMPPVSESIRLDNACGRDDSEQHRAISQMRALNAGYYSGARTL